MPQENEQLPLWIPIPPAPRQWFLAGCRLPNGKYGLNVNTGVYLRVDDCEFERDDLLRDYVPRQICSLEPDRLTSVSTTFHSRPEQSNNLMCVGVEALRSFLAEEANLGLRELLREIVNE